MSFEPDFIEKLYADYELALDQAKLFYWHALDKKWVARGEDSSEVGWTTDEDGAAKQVRRTRKRLAKALKRSISKLGGDVEALYLFDELDEHYRTLTGEKSGIPWRDIVRSVDAFVDGEVVETGRPPNEHVEIVLGIYFSHLKAKGQKISASFKEGHQSPAIAGAIEFMAKVDPNVPLTPNASAAIIKKYQKGQKRM